ncbi:MAG: D-alanyl-D-alanine carboxypeptidase [Pontiellaceae bacterium]|nr:D-alanyl-D-alanine carboxypeptidase [Pontiellaceae bacterium]MBN2784975.1 D-alanyl-D-alanine carboxypeptidase [Pontiellaceae bacterium]
MKKINVLVIAVVLIAIHLLVLAALVGRKDKTEVPPKEHSTARQENPAKEPELAPDFEVPELRIPAPSVEETTVTTASPPPSPGIATPGSIPGTIRSDRPESRTTKTYPKLVGNPYQSMIVVDAKTGRILAESRATAYAYPASVTKMMTMLIVLEQIDAGRIALTDTVRITDEVAQIGGSQIWLDPRETNFTVNDLLYALMVHSANDAARALALHVAGSKDAFVEMMNQKAGELGMNSTVYHSDHGLPPPDGAQPDISTAYDIAILSLALLRHPETLHYTETELKYLRDGKTMLATRNALIKRVDGYPGCDGLKTGYHGMGGWSLAATAEHNGNRVIAIALGCPDKQTRNSTVRKLLDLGFSKLNN